MEDKSERKQNLNIISLVAIVAIVAIVGMVFFNQKTVIVPLSEDMLMSEDMFLEEGTAEESEGVLLSESALVGEAARRARAGTTTSRARTTTARTATQTVSGVTVLPVGSRHTLQPGTESMVNLYIESITDVPAEGKKLIQWCVTTTHNTEGGTIQSQRYTIILTSTKTAPFEAVIPDPSDVHDETADVQETRTSSISGKTKLTATFITYGGKDGLCVKTKELSTKQGKMITLQTSSDKPYKLYADGETTPKCTDTVSPFKCPNLNARAELTAPAPGITLTPSRTINVKAGSPITVSWINNNPTKFANDWITLMKVGLADAEGTAENGFNGWVRDGEPDGIRELTTNPRNPWFFICADPACTLAPQMEGRKTLKAPSKNPDGSPISTSTQYELRYYENDGFTTRKDNPTVARVITVTPTRVTTPTCTGTTPSNGQNVQLCPDDNTGLPTPPPSKILVDTCTTATKCEYKCNDGFHKEGNVCVVNPPGPPSAPTNLVVVPCSSFDVTNNKFVTSLKWTPGSGGTFHAIVIDDPNGNIPGASRASGCVNLQPGDSCRIFSGVPTQGFTPEDGRSYKWWVHSCNGPINTPTPLCSAPTAGPDFSGGCRFMQGGVTLTPSPTQTGPAEQINPTTGAAITVTLSVLPGVTLISGGDIITFAPTTTNLPITHKNNHPSGTTADSNGIVSDSIAMSKYGQGTVKHLTSEARSVTINAPIIPGNYKLRYYDNGIMWEVPSYLVGISDATIVVT